jgi:hypothetical protein
MNVTAKTTGYHPASGLHLVEGETYTIDAAVFAADVFTESFTKQAPKVSEPEEVLNPE